MIDKLKEYISTLIILILGHPLESIILFIIPFIPIAILLFLGYSIFYVLLLALIYGIIIWSSYYIKSIRKWIKSNWKKFFAIFATVTIASAGIVYEFGGDEHPLGDETFGLTETCSAWVDLGTDSSVTTLEYQRGLLASPSNDGTLTKISVYVKNDDSDEDLGMMVALYDTSGNKLAESSETEIPHGETGDWYDLSISYSLVGSTNYYLVAYAEAGTHASPMTAGIKIDGTTKGKSYTMIYEDEDNYPTWEDPWSGYTTAEASHLSIYGTYTVAGGNPPVNSNPSPANVATGVSQNPSLEITINDPDGNTMNQTFWTNASESWVAIGWHNDTGNDTVSNTTTVFTQFNTKYYWSSNVSDGTGNWDNDTYYFTTKDMLSPQNFSAAYSDSETISLSWDKNDSASTTLVLGKVDSYPTGTDDGTATTIYNSTGESTTHSITKGQIWYCVAWSYNVTANAYSSLNSSDIAGYPVRVIAQSPINGSTTIPYSTSQVSITIENDLGYFNYTIQGSFLTNKVGVHKLPDTYTTPIPSELTPGNTYYWWVNITNYNDSYYVCNNTYHFTVNYDPWSYDVCVIYNDTYGESEEEHADEFKAWKEATSDYEVLCVNFTNITSNSSFWVTGYYGDDNPANPYYGGNVGLAGRFNDTAAMVRNYIRYLTINHSNMSHIILMGDDARFEPRHYRVWHSGGWEDVSLPDIFYYGALYGCQDEDEWGYWDGDTDTTIDIPVSKLVYASDAGWNT